MSDTHASRSGPSQRGALDEWLLTHDYAHTMGGAERCTAAIAEILPNAPAWIIGGSRDIVEEVFGGRPTKSFLPMEAFGANAGRLMTPILYPLLRLIPPTRSNIFASSYALAHLRRSHGLKIIYCHSPFRQIYSGVHEYFPNFPASGQLLDLLLGPFRWTDKRAAQEAQVVIATNSIVADRVRRFWGRAVDAVIPPPIDTELFKPSAAPERSYFLWAGRIVEPYKKLSLVMEAFAALPDERLIVVGEGRDKDLLQSRAPGNIQFVGKKSGAHLAHYYANAKAVVFPSADDFGMVPLEAMSTGTPVIGFSGGGARETIIPGLTGVLYDESNTACLKDAMAKFNNIEWNSLLIREYALSFSKEAFISKISSIIASEVTREDTSNGGSYRAK